MFMYIFLICFVSMLVLMIMYYYISNYHSRHTSINTLSSLKYTNRLPVMMAARKLDGEDPNIIFMLRCIYGAVQAIAVLVTLFIYIKATAASNESGNAVKIYVSPPPQVSIV